MILVTGTEGLIGSHLCARLEASGFEVRRFDLSRSRSEDICRTQSLAVALEGVRGVIHLAAISRVVWAEQNPHLCLNVEALAELLDLCRLGTKPWLIFASSREVYGEARRLPVREDDPLHPMNAYGRSKRAGELLIGAANSSGLLANTCRLSNVYGWSRDHPDRVVMAFAIAAARGGVISVEGRANAFDFTHIDDVVEGLWRLVQATIAG